MANILNELWDGEIHPQDSLIDGNEYYKNLQHLLSRNQAELAGTLSDEQKPVLTEDEIELLTVPTDLAEYRTAITDALYKGTKRNIQSEEDSSGKNGAVG